MVLRAIAFLVQLRKYEIVALRNVVVTKNYWPEAIFEEPHEKHCKNESFVSVKSLVNSEGDEVVAHQVHIALIMHFDQNLHVTIILHIFPHFDKVF